MDRARQIAADAADVERSNRAADLYGRPKKLLNLDNNAKTVKGQRRGYKTAVLYLAPADLSGFEVCPMRTAGCTKACLNTAGRGAIPRIQASRIAKTKWFFSDRAGFMAQLVKELAAFVRKSRAEGYEVAVRLNGTSDILWERVPIELREVERFVQDDDLIRNLHTNYGYVVPNIMTLFRDVQFYDYTKHNPAKRHDKPVNYHLTYSFNEDPGSWARASYALEIGWNVAVVFRNKPPKHFGIVPVVDGDEDDLRFLEHGVVVGLKAKGLAKKDRSGFVRE